MSYTLTSLGKVLALKRTNVNDPEDAVITYLYEHPETIEIDELVGELHSSENTILKVVNRLLNADSPLIKEL